MGTSIELYINGNMLKSFNWNCFSVLVVFTRALRDYQDYDSSFPPDSARSHCKVCEEQ